MANGDHKTVISHKANISTNMCGPAIPSQDTSTFTFSLQILLKLAHMQSKDYNILIPWKLSNGEKKGEIGNYIREGTQCRQKLGERTQWRAPAVSHVVKDNS
jgi:hypothetical protein